MRYKSLCFIAAILVLISVNSCSYYKPFLVENENYQMGTIITQKVYGSNAKKAASEVTERIGAIEASMTINSPGGDINKLNEMAGKGKVLLNKDTIYVLEKAIHFSELSGGAFDVTVGPIVKAWAMISENPQIPDSDKIRSLVNLVNYKDIDIDSIRLEASLARPGQIVDLGAIAKGYAADEAARIYKSNGIKSAYINLGGNVMVVGSRPDGNPWRIAIQNPRGESGDYIGVVDVSDKTVVTSGDYERYFEKNGIRYHHIIDPKTGYPSDSGLISVTIVADISVDADALSTSAFILGLDKGMELVKSISGTEAIFITKDKKVYVTAGLKNVFEFNDSGSGFSYIQM